MVINHLLNGMILQVEHTRNRQSPGNAKYDPGIPESHDT